jgi:hydroxysqualene dehydroxylase
MRVPIAIVGGGWAGIACAVELADHGLPVTLFESARQLGGRARRVDWDGLAIDNGQHLMIGAYRETLRLMTRLGTANTLERRPLQLRMPGLRLSLPPWPKPLHLGIGLLVARGLSARDKLAAARFMRHLQATHFALPNDMPVNELLARHSQPANLIDKLWAPLCLAALNTPLAMASARVFCNVLRDSLAGERADSDLLFNRADLGRLLADAATALLLQRQCEIHVASKVDSLSRVAGGFHLHGPECLAERVVLAPHPVRLPAMLDKLQELAGIAEPLSRYTWQPIHTLWLRFASPIRFPFPMIGLGDSLAPWAFERNDIAPGVVALVTSADGPHLRLTAERLRDDYLNLLAGQLGALPKLLGWKAIIEKRATYSCVVDQHRPDNRTPLPGLYLAGDFTAGDYPATLEGAVRSGVECARHLIAE